MLSVATLTTCQLRLCRWRLEVYAPSLAAVPTRKTKEKERNPEHLEGMEVNERESGSSLDGDQRQCECLPERPSLRAKWRKEGCSRSEGGQDEGRTRESRRFGTASCWNVGVQACFLAVLFVSVMPLAIASAKPRLHGSSSLRHRSARAATDLWSSSPARSRQNRGIGASSDHWNLFEFVPSSVAIPKAQCEAGCMTRTVSYECIV